MSKSLNWVEIDRLVLAHYHEDPVSSIAALERNLRRWWCLTYNRPFKDPLLDQYTLDELVYEFLTKHYLKPENDPDKLEERKQKDKEDEEWAEKMIEQEMQKMQKMQSSASKSPQATENTEKTNKIKPKKSKRPKKTKSDPEKELPDVIFTKFDMPEE